MRIAISHLRAAGLNDSQIVKVLEEADAERREKERIKKRNQRARPRDGGDGRDIGDTALSLSKEEKVYPKEASKKVRKKENKQPLSENWQPIGPQRDPAEAEEFRDHARAKGWKYSDWNAAYRNYQRSPYNARNKNSTAPPTVSDEQKRAAMAAIERDKWEQLNGKRHEAGIRPNTGMGQARPGDKGQLRLAGGSLHGDDVESRQIADAISAVARHLRN